MTISFAVSNAYFSTEFKISPPFNTPFYHAGSKGGNT
nr:MAG TPA: Protein of unknown function (DUF3417) [Podoviridae sp. ct13o21]